jgi:signal transduction histidine kinase
MKSISNGILILNIKQKGNNRDPAIKIKDCNAFFECFAKRRNKINKLSDIFPNNGIWIEDQIKNNLARNSFDFEGYFSDLGDKYRVSAHKVGKKELVLVFTQLPSQSLNSYNGDNEKQLVKKYNNKTHTSVSEEKGPIKPEILLNTTNKEEKTISSFFSNASHETKTLLNGIIGFAQFLKFKGQQENDAYVDVIINSGNRLLKVTNNLLYFTRLEAGYVRVKPYKCSLNNELDKLHSEIYEGNEDLKKKQVEFKTSYDLPNGEDKLFIDNFNLMEVLKRLLDNAFKFTAEGEVRLEYKVKNNNQLIFYVKDTGQGISEEKKSDILDTSTQLQDKIHGEIKGIGLGLVIARKLVNLMGGELNFDSKEGKGSSFYFNIPFKYAQQGKFMLNENQKQKPSVKISGLTDKKHMVG